MLRQVPAGHKVRYHHKRTYREREWPYIRDEYSLSPQGGTTTARILDPEGNEIATGQAICRPDENYKKAMGREIALGRALKQLEQKEQMCQPRS